MWFGSSMSPLADAYDVGTGTYCTGSGNGGPRFLWTTGHGLSSYFTVDATINSITVTTSTLPNPVNFRWASHTVSVQVGGVDVGTPSTIAAGGVQSHSLTGITAADLLDPSMEIQIQFNRGPSAITGDFSIDYADLIIDYTPGSPIPSANGTWGTLTI